ncbi:hypothetical protein [Streptosporangium sp. NPDC023615]|uniref:hypothetical protein n=1 Tax=Streptosporangium sp. NPDC023615 TaxID=3154794 RepID=UPI0034412772
MIIEHAPHARAARLAPGVPIEITPIQVGADLWHGDLAEIGGKGAFSKEIDRALTGGRIDIAVHCMKDVPGDVPLAEGTSFGACLPRDDVHDVVVTRDGVPPAGLPAGSLIGTSSVRRRAQLGIQALSGDTPAMRVLDELDHPVTARHVLAERTMPHLLSGHCNSPIAGHASTTPDGGMSLSGMVFNHDGSAFVRSQARGTTPTPPPSAPASPTTCSARAPTT